MAKVKHIGYLQDSEKEFLKLFDKLTCSRSAWQVWEDLITVMACSISNAVDRTPDKFKRREEQYGRAVKRLGGVEIPAQILGIITMALEKDPDQDFLGKLYMNLNLGSHWHGQFFTPYNVCRMMAEMNFRDRTQDEIKRKGYISVCDPCVGAGAMLIAAANTMRRAKVNYQTNAVFVGQDIDRVVAMMAYIQLSLIGCPGYIIIGNSLMNPPTGHVLFPQDTDGQEVWITPMFITDVWTMRRQCCLLEQLCGTVTTEETMEISGFNENNISGQNKGRVDSMGKQGEKGKLGGKQMNEKIFGEIQTTEELNELAVNLRKNKEYDEIRLLCSENHISGNIPEEFIQGKRLHLAEPGHQEKYNHFNGEAKLEAAPEGGKEAEEKGKAGSVYTVDDARKRLEAELKIYRDGDSRYVVEKLVERCETDRELLNAVMLPHKSYGKAFQYFFQKGMEVGYKIPQGFYLDNDCAVRLSIEYFKRDDAADEKKSPPKKNNTDTKDKGRKTPKKQAVLAEPKEPSKAPEEQKQEPKHNKNEMAGQMSLFDLQGVCG